ncbi:MAG: hypothetical protein KDB10_07505 [Acidimicrobiales bacterium]|nr:hypothetical protein [Acidimicrobiales bacterium]
MRDAEELVARVEPLLPTIAANAAEGERRRRLPDETLALLRDAEVFRALVSPERGGHGLGLDSVVALGLTLGRADTATAWVTTFLVMHNWLLSMFPAAVVDDAFGDRGYALAPAALSPTGTATPVPDGYRVSGRWSWGTGVMHADAALVTGVVTGDDGALDLRMVLVLPGEFDVDDVWHTDGMRATGSNDVVCRDVLVPAERTVSFVDLAEGRGHPVAGTPLAGYPLVPVLCLTAAAPLVGGAGGAFEAYRARLSERVLAYTLGDRQAEKPSAQIRLARADVDLQAARLLLDDCVRRLDRAYGPGGHGMARADRSPLRQATVTAVHTAKRAVASLCDAAGGSVHLLDQPLQRFQRDLNTGAGHAVFDEDRAAETRGRVLVGLGPGPTDLL